MSSPIGKLKVCVCEVVSPKESREVSGEMEKLRLGGGEGGNKGYNE